MVFPERLQIFARSVNRLSKTPPSIGWWLANHPSGERYSLANRDKSITTKLRDGLKLLELHWLTILLLATANTLVFPTMTDWAMLNHAKNCNNHWARPQIIKAAAISRAIKNKFAGKIEEIIVHWAALRCQHEPFFDEMGIPGTEL